MSTVIITSCDNAFEAELIKGNLENEGIESFVSNENYTSLYPNMNGAMGSGIQIFVDEKDAERALQVINHGEKAIKCPRCNSNDIKQIMNYHWYQKLAALLLGLLTFHPVGNMQSKYQCNSCGDDFVI